MSAISVSLAQFAAAQEIINGVLTPTPQISWPLLSERIGIEVWVKHENHLPTGSFKVRGGLVFADSLRTTGVQGVVAATRGNHGQSVAFAARRQGLQATIVVPYGNNPDKNRAMCAYGAELQEYGKDFDDAYEQAQTIAAKRQWCLFPSFDERLVAGVGTYAIEFFRAAPDLDAVYVPIGLGSGICGVMAARDALNLHTEVIGVVASGADTYAQSFEKRKLCATANADTVADGLAVRIPNAQALESIIKGASRVVRVTDEQIMRAMAIYFSDTHQIAEGAGAAPLAALIAERERQRGRRCGVILSGGNIDAERYRQVLSMQSDREVREDK